MVVESGRQHVAHRRNPEPGRPHGVGGYLSGEVRHGREPDLGARGNVRTISDWLLIGVAGPPPLCLTCVMVDRSAGSAVLASRSLPGLLMAWLPGQRWFAGGARITNVDLMSDIQLASGDPEYRHLMVRVWTGETATTYQVPVGLRTGLPPELDSAMIGRVADGRTAYDALH